MRPSAHLDHSSVSGVGLRRSDAETSAAPGFPSHPGSVDRANDKTRGRREGTRYGSRDTDTVILFRAMFGRMLAAVLYTID